MDLPNSVVSDFAKLVSPDSQKGEQILYGYVTSVSVDEDDERIAMVRFDGSAVDTPASLSMDAEQGDRVSVLVKNHEATVNGNITSPASARTATKYMRFTNDGLIIGSLSDSGSPDGNYILITDSAYYIKNSSDATLLSVSSDGTRVIGPDGVLKASFLSGGTTLYSGGLMRLLLNSNGVTIYDPTGTKTMAKFSSSGIEIYNENGVITSKFDATGAVLLNPTANDNDGVRIYNGSQANAANLLASFVASGIKLHALVTSGGTTVNRTLAEFLNSGLKFYDQNGVLKMILDGDGIKLYKDSNNYAANFLSSGTRLYNQNGKRTFIANGDGVTLYDNDEIPTASFTQNGLVLYGRRDGVRIYDAPSSDDPNAPHTAQLLASFISDGVRLHALVTSNGTTVNRTVAEFLNTGLKFRNQSGVLQTSMDANGLKLYNKDGEVTASFEDKGCVLYGRNDGIRIYDSPTVANVHTRQLLASFKSDGVRLHEIKNGVNTIAATFTADKATLAGGNGTVEVDGNIAVLKGTRGSGCTTSYDATDGRHYTATIYADSAKDTSTPKNAAHASLYASEWHNVNGVPLLNEVEAYVDTNGFHVTHNNKTAEINGSEIVTAGNISSKLPSSVITTSNIGSHLPAIATGSTSVQNGALGGHLTDFTVTPSLSSGYSLIGVSGIDIKRNSDNRRTIHLQLNQFRIESGTIHVVVYNDDPNDDTYDAETGTYGTLTDVTVYWTAFKAGS